MNISAAKSYAMIVLFVMLIVFSILGFTAMKPQSTQKNIDAFWISVIAFLLLLAAYIFFFVSPLLSIAPLFPVYIFTKCSWRRESPPRNDDSPVSRRHAERENRFNADS